MNQLVDTEEILKALSVNLRITAYSAIDASNHLAVHSAEVVESLAMHELAVKLSEFAEVTRAIGEAHSRS